MMMITCRISLMPCSTGRGVLSCRACPGSLDAVGAGSPWAGSAAPSATTAPRTTVALAIEGKRGFIPTPDLRPAPDGHRDTASPVLPRSGTPRLGQALSNAWRNVKPARIGGHKHSGAGQACEAVSHGRPRQPLVPLRGTARSPGPGASRPVAAPGGAPGPGAAA